MNFLAFLEALQFRVVVAEGDYDSYLLPFLKERYIKCCEGFYFTKHGLSAKDTFRDVDAEKQSKFLSTILEDADYAPLQVYFYKDNCYSFLLKNILINRCSP